VPSDILDPAALWKNANEYNTTLSHLADLYKANFARYASGGGFVSSELAQRIVAAGPRIEGAPQTNGLQH
jgi:ATP-dependent phosphoenolpyruvate carboxykinase